MSSAVEATLALCHRAAATLAGTPAEPEVQAVTARLQGPLRLAVAGRVKAGKSTLVNALVGEQLAPTDAGECTRVVTWYRHALSYEVQVRRVDGSTSPLPFVREDGLLHIDLGSVDTADVDRIDVGWPARSLQDLLLIDTPGLASINEDISARSLDFFAVEDDRATDADAVLYLMRHLHRSDAEFLGGFLDPSAPSPSPVNAVALLSRADEIGGGRPDALDAARRIAARYRRDPDVRALCATVLPIAGLLAETGLTLRADEVEHLRLLAGTPAEQLDDMLLAAELFLDPNVGLVTLEHRRRLFARLGLYGIRLSVGALRDGTATSSQQLARLLVERSGLADLRATISDHFLPRARLLKARVALSALRRVARRIATTDPAAARLIETDAERIEVTSPEFAALRLAHLVLSGAVAVDDSAVAEVDRVTSWDSPIEVRLGFGATSEATEGVSAAELRAAALSGAARWRERGADPLADTPLVEASETMARCYEGIHAAIRG